MRVLVLSLATTLLASAAAHGQTVIYDNLETFTLNAYLNGGAVQDGANRVTLMVADDIEPITNYVGESYISSFTMAVANFNSGAGPLNVRMLFRFWDPIDLGVNDLPGDLIAAFNVPLTFPSIVTPTYYFLTVTLPFMSFMVPDDFFWAGVAFDNNDGAFATTLAQLDNFGMVTFDPPTIGSSFDLFFETDNAGGNYLVNNPAGGFYFFGGTPVANFGWQFTVRNVPEPTTIALIGLGLCGCVPAYRRWRVAKQQVEDAKAGYASKA